MNILTDQEWVILRWARTILEPVAVGFAVGIGFWLASYVVDFSMFIVLGLQS